MEGTKLQGSFKKRVHTLKVPNSIYPDSNSLIRSVLVADGYSNDIIRSTFTKKIRQFNQLSQHAQNARFTSTFYAGKRNMKITRFKSKLLIQPLRIAILLFKHVLLLQLSLFYPRLRRMYYLPITATISFINLCATATVGT